VLTLLPEVLRSLFNQLGGLEGGASLAQKVDQIRMPIYGILLIVLMLSRPQGVFGSRELWDAFPKWWGRAWRSDE
jgi:branched-chain amino acid transport system permease protein